MEENGPFLEPELYYNIVKDDKVLIRPEAENFLAFL